MRPQQFQGRVTEDHHCVLRQLRINQQIDRDPVRRRLPGAWRAQAAGTVTPSAAVLVGTQQWTRQQAWTHRASRIRCRVVASTGVSPTHSASTRGRSPGGETDLPPTPEDMRQAQRHQGIRHVPPCFNGIDRLPRQPAAGRQGLLAQARRLAAPGVDDYQLVVPTRRSI